MSSPPLPEKFESRRAQMFPVLVPEERERLRRFGQVRPYADGERLQMAGGPGPGLIVLLRGRVRVSRRDGLGHALPIVEEGPGSFLGEVGQLAGQPALVDVHALEAVEALVIPPASLRALLVAEAGLGERIMRALILRRTGLVDADAGGPILVGPRDGVGMLRLRVFLQRNGHPYHARDPADDAEARALLDCYAPSASELPLVVLPDGAVLRNPPVRRIAQALGMLADRACDTLYDVAVVGAGPGGLATAVYAASEGLRVLVLDASAFGGQAGESSRIENYFGFPTGITGQALTARAYVQALKFGAELAIPVEVRRLYCEAPGLPLQLTLDDGREVHARTVVVASGAQYRRPALPNLRELEGRGISYWASPVEARMCGGEEVLIVGGGNSAGQGAVYLAEHARRVRMLVRGPGLAASMSHYLIERIAASPRIQLQTETEVVALEGGGEEGLRQVRIRHRPSGREEVLAVRHLFLFIGAEPATQWLEGCGVALDEKGFVCTGADVPSGDGARRAPLESSVPGVFAVGDVRAGSVKRVGGAIGEGAAVVAQVHAYLAGAREEAGHRAAGPLRDAPQPAAH